MASVAQTVSARRDRHGAAFVATILTGSFLLFLVQPMIARMALPRLGGAPAVWNSAMLVYQALLLGGYAYAHAIGRLAPRRQALIHLAVFAVGALWLPIGLIGGNPPADANPIVWVPWLLTLSIGPLFFAVAAQAPLMQRWFSLATGGRDPYALYAASNLGSFGGLIAYPLLVEPNMPIAAQSMLWSTGYALLAALVTGCTLLLPRGATKYRIQTPASPQPASRRQLHWILLAAVPSGLMLSTTTHLTTDIVAMPLLWVIPLGLYLLSFSVAFASNRVLADAVTKVAPVVILALGGFALVGDGSGALFRSGLSLLLLLVVAIALHTQMYRLRPDADRLTGFYLAMSIGGVLGGLFAALIAPAVFDWTYEHPVLIVAAAALAPQIYPLDRLRRFWTDARTARIATLAIVITAIGCTALAVSLKVSIGPGALIFLLALASLGRTLPFTVAVAGLLVIYGGWVILKDSVSDARTRSYFGIYTVRDYPHERVRRLVHGTTVHGMQTNIPGLEAEPTTYYARRSAVGRALERLPVIYGRNTRIGIVGLGVGTLACYRRPGQSWRFYEIDPAVVGIARDSGQFSVLSRCAPGMRVEIGDARLTLAHTPAASLDFLALDAFSSDSVPMHLLTREAFQIYRRVLAKDGLLLVHISNRYLDLKPVVAAAARDGGWSASGLYYMVSRDPQPAPNALSSQWVAMSPDPQVIARLVAGDPPAPSGTWRPLREKPVFTPWTDNFSSILPLVRAWAPPVDEN